MSTKITTEEFIKHTDIELYNEMFGSSGKQRMGKFGKKRPNPQKEWEKKKKQQHKQNRNKKQGL